MPHVFQVSVKGLRTFNASRQSPASMKRIATYTGLMEMKGVPRGFLHGAPTGKDAS